MSDYDIVSLLEHTVEEASEIGVTIERMEDGWEINGCPYSTVDDLATAIMAISYYLEAKADERFNDPEDSEGSSNSSDNTKL